MSGARAAGVLALLVATAQLLQDSIAVKSADGAGACSADSSAVCTASLLQQGRKVGVASTLHQEQESGTNTLELADGEFLMRQVTALPQKWKPCNKFKCDQWQEFAACGVTEQELYDKLVADKSNMNRIIVGAHFKKAKKYGPYVSQSPMACSSSDVVHFLVNNAGNIGRAAVDKVIRSLKALGMSEPFTCDAEHWLRVRMSESMEARPNKYLLDSLPEFMNFADSDPALAQLLEQARQLEDRLADAAERGLEAEEAAGEEASLLQGEEASLSAALEELERRIDATLGGLHDTFQRLRDRFGHSHGIALGARFVRMIFHDAADYKNLIDARGNRVCGPNLTCGGVDFRLHTALLSVGLTQHSLPVDDQTDPDDVYAEDGEDAEALGDPNHNRGLTNAFQWVHAWGGHTSLLSKADIVVLGAHVAMETWFSGPEMDYEAGRVDAMDNRSSGSLLQKLHEAEYCTDEHCIGKGSLFLASPVAEPVGDGMFCPFGNTLTELAGLLGLSEKELIALQGSHSIGGIIRCSGMGNTASGPFCGGAVCCPPGMEDRGGACECTSPDCRGLSAGLNGATFDGTPNKLDNLYYKQLDRANFSELPECSEVEGRMPGLSSGDQAIFICMKKKGLKWKGDDLAGSGGNGSSWEEAVAAGCGEVVKKAYKGGSKEQKCRADWGASGNGMSYPARQWCSVDDCLQRCEESNACGADKPLSEIGVMMGRFQNKDYGKKCHHVVKTFDPAVVESVLGAIPKDQYMNTTLTSDVQLTDGDDEDFQAKGLRVSHCGTSKGSVGRNRTSSSKCRMKSYLQKILDKIPRDRNGMLTRPVRMDFADPADPYCNQCTTPVCEADALAALENAMGHAKPPDKTNAEWLKDFMAACKQCKEDCLKADAKSNGKARNRKPEWCLRKSGTSFCARGGHTHECPKEHRYGIPNHGDGRRSMILNTMRWARFRGQTRRIMLLPSDWSYLGNDVHRGYIHEFAQDNDHFQEHWKLAFQKVTKLGMTGNPKACQAASCVVGTGGASIVCAESFNPGIGVERLTFDKCAPTKNGTMSPPTLAAGTACSLTRNFGVRAVFQCHGKAGVLYCTTARGQANERVAEKELSSGSDMGKCWQDYGILAPSSTLKQWGMREDDR